MSDDQWFGLEVQRPVVVPGDDELVDYSGGTFCGQEHAALWLAKPLPEPEPPELVTDKSDLLFWIGFWAVMVVTGGAALVGLWTIVRWILH